MPHASVDTLIALGLPVSAEGRGYSYDMLHTSHKPKLMLSGEADEFASPEQLAEVFAAAAAPKRLVLIPGADHFFAGKLDAMRAKLGGWLGEILGQNPAGAL